MVLWTEMIPRQLQLDNTRFLNFQFNQPFLFCHFGDLRALPAVFISQLLMTAFSKDSSPADTQGMKTSMFYQSDEGWYGFMGVAHPECQMRQIPPLHASSGVAGFCSRGLRLNLVESGQT